MGVAITQVIKTIEPLLAENGFVRQGKRFIRPEGNLNGLIELRRTPRRGEGIARFRVEWGITLPGAIARYGGLNAGRAATGPTLIPPRKHYGGQFPRERQSDRLWAVREGSSEGVEACAAALYEELKKHALPLILELSKPGALREEFFTKQEGRRLRHTAWWQGDAIYLLIEDGDHALIRDLAAQDDEFEGFLTWVEDHLKELET